MPAQTRAPRSPTLIPAATSVPTSDARTFANFQRIFIIVFENLSFSRVMADPYFTDLAKRGALMTNYHGVSHPSQPNYIAMVAGDPLVQDDNRHNLPQTNLVDLLEAGSVSWKAYFENYPGQCNIDTAAGDTTTGQYVRRHNPFISFDNIRTNPARCAHLVNSDQLNNDLANGTLPSYSFYVPNLYNDAHDKPLAYAANYLKTFLEPKLVDPVFMNSTLVVVTFDEDERQDDPSLHPIYTVLLGSMVRAGSTDQTNYNHYSLLRAIEDNFSLGTLGRNDASATPLAKCNFAGGC